MATHKTNRRAFFKFAAAAPAAIAEAATTAPAMLAHAGVMPTQPPPFGVGILHHPVMMAAKAAGMLPAWAQQEVDNELRERARAMSPDIASLRSVSLSSKFRMQESAMRRRFDQAWPEHVARDQARRMFWKQNGPDTW